MKRKYGVDEEDIEKKLEEDEDLDLDLDKPSVEDEDEDEKVEDEDESEEESEDSDDEEETSEDEDDDEEAEDEDDDEEAEDDDSEEEHTSCGKDSAIPARKLKKGKAKRREKKMGLSLDSLPKEVMIQIAARDNLVQRLRPVLGDFAYDCMDIEGVAKYACDKLHLGVKKRDAVAAIHGYLVGAGQTAQKVYSMDSAVAQDCSIADSQIEKYLKGE